MNDSSPVALADRIATLPDSHALATLAAVAQRHGLTFDAGTIITLDQRIGQALAQPQLRPHLPATGTPLSDGDVARAALTHLAASHARDIEQALSVPEPHQRFEPATLALGALVLFAFHSDIELRRDPETGWYFHFKVTPLPHTTIAQILGRLYGAHHPDPP